MAAIFPTRPVDYARDEFHKTNALGITTLNGTIAANSLLISVDNAAVYSTWPTENFVIRIENELIFVTSRSGGDLTVADVADRGYNDTTAASHTDDGILEVRVVASSAFLQQIAQEIIALQDWPGVAASFIHASVSTTPYTATLDDAVIPVTAAAAAATVNLPTAVGIEGRYMTIIKTDGSVNTVTVDGFSSQTIGGQLTRVLYAQNEALVVVSDGANWQVVSTVEPLHRLNAAAGPGVGDDSADGYSPGSIWVDTTNDAAYVCLDASAGAAVWTEITQETIPPLAWTEVTGTSQALVANNGYNFNNAATVTGTLPAVAAIGDIFRVTQKGAGVARIAQNAGQSIRFGDLVTTTGVGGYIESTLAGDTVELECITANTTFKVISSHGNWTVVGARTRTQNAVNRRASLLENANAKTRQLGSTDRPIYFGATNAASNTYSEIPTIKKMAFYTSGGTVNGQYGMGLVMGLPGSNIGSMDTTALDTGTVIEFVFFIRLTNIANLAANMLAGAGLVGQINSTPLGANAVFSRAAGVVDRRIIVGASSAGDVYVVTANGTDPPTAQDTGVNAVSGQLLKIHIVWTVGTGVTVYVDDDAGTTVTTTLPAYTNVVVHGSGNTSAATCETLCEEAVARIIPA